LARTIELWVDSQPQPAKRSFPAGMCFRAVSKTLSFSVSDRYGISPFDPRTTYPARGYLFHFSKLSAKAFRFNSPPRRTA